MPKSAAWTLLLSPALAFAQTASPATTATELPEVEVAAPAAALTGVSTEDGYAVGSVGGEGLQTLSGPARTNAFRSLDTLPSVNFTATDPYGLTVDQNFLRIRGVAGYTYSNLAASIEGTPSSVSAGQGAVGNLFDLENVAGMRLYKGVVPANVGFGMGDLAGAVDLQLRGPAKTRGGELSLGIGSDGFQRRFARVDSGEFGNGSALFFSVSDAQNDKWTGPGEIKRNAFNAGFSQDFGRDVKLQIFAAHSRFRRNEYRPLTSSQLGSFKDDYDDWDYNRHLTGTSSQDALYYGYNTQSFDENNVIGVLDWRISDDTRLQFRPYWLSSDGVRYVGKTTSTSGTVTKVDIAQEQSGAVLELNTRVLDQQLTAGYWWGRSQTMPPPMSQKVYSLTSSGDLSFSKWGILAYQGSREFNSPYLKFDGGSGNWHYDAGLRWLHESLPGVTTYTATGVPDIGLISALDSNPPVNAKLTTGASGFNKLLPSLSSRWTLSPAWEARVAYGRAVGNPWLGPLYSSYMSNAAKFAAQGISLQDLWKRLRMETSDTVETGASWKHAGLRLDGTLFYSKIRDKQVNAYDPLVGVSYLQSGVDATAYGAELAANWALSPGLSLFGSATWNVNKMDDDLVTGSGTSVATSGKQITDTPKWMAKLGANYRYGPVSLTGVLRYVGSRYGDALNEEKVADYTTADLYADWKLGRTLGMDFNLNLAVQNLFDQKYIGSINEGKDDSLPGEVLYYLGAPRSVALTLGARF